MPPALSGENPEEAILDNQTYTDAAEENNTENFIEVPSSMEDSGTVLEEPAVAENDFVAYFPTLFDDGFFARFEPKAREKRTNLWEEAGWRGFLVADGLMWSHDARLVTAVNYLSKAEEARLAALERAEIATLSPELRDGVTKPLFAFEAGDAASGKWRGRVDAMKDETFRLALWRAGRDLGGPADVACQVAKRPDGQLGTAYYFPQETAEDMPIEEFVPYRLEFCHPFASLETGLVWEDGSPSLVMVVSEDGKTQTRLGGTECRWSVLRAAKGVKNE